jgi:NADH dehydrogenase
MILVAGATGSLGSKIATGFQSSGQSVRALVRPTSNAGSLENGGISIARGDLRDIRSLEAACAAVRVVISTASATNRSDDTPDNVDARGNQNLIDAARRAGVRHFVLISTLGASPESPLPAFRAKAAAEESLRQSGISYTILQPNAFMDVWFGMLIEAPVARGQPVTLVGESKRRHSFIAERDVAALAMAAIEHPAARNTTMVLGGPDAVTLQEVVRAYETVLGRSIPVLRVAPGEPIPGLPQPVWGIAAALETYDSPIPMEDTARTFGMTLTSVSAFVSTSRLVSQT